MGKATVVAIAALTTLALSAGAIRSSALTASAGSALDDPTIVAIFDAANTADIGIGSCIV